MQSKGRHHFSDQKLLSVIKIKKEKDNFVDDGNHRNLPAKNNQYSFLYSSTIATSNDEDAN